MIKKDVDLSLRDRHVLLVEDIVDTGHTLNTILAMLRLRRPKSLRLCALLDKPDRREVDVPIDYLGFSIENVFVVGYGLDYAERWRNLPYVGVVRTCREHPTQETLPWTSTTPTTRPRPSAPTPRPSRSATWSSPPARSASTRRPASWPTGSPPRSSRCCANLSHVLATAGCGFGDVLKTTIYLADMGDFPVLNELYGAAMGDHRPARSTVEVASLPKGALVEIDFIARKR